VYAHFSPPSIPAQHFPFGSIAAQVAGSPGIAAHMEFPGGETVVVSRDGGNNRL
jgi:hypothetical protein